MPGPIGLYIKLGIAGTRWLVDLAKAVKDGELSDEEREKLKPQIDELGEKIAELFK